MFIATKTVTIHLPNGKQLKLVKDTNVSNGSATISLAKLTAANYTSLLSLHNSLVASPIAELSLRQLGYFTQTLILWSWSKWYANRDS